MAMAAQLVEQGVDLYARNLRFIEEEIKIRDDLRPNLATENTVRLDLRTMVLRDYGTRGGIPTLVDAPHAGHTAVIADYHKGQSLVETLLENGIAHVALTDWKPATEDMKDLEIDNYLAELIVAIDDLGGRVNLVGLCQGGWVSGRTISRQGQFARACRRADRHRLGKRANQAPSTSITNVLLRGIGGTRRRADEGKIHAAGLEEHAPRAALYSGSHRSLRAYRRSGLPRQGRGLQPLV